MFELCDNELCTVGLLCVPGFMLVVGISNGAHWFVIKRQAFRIVSQNTQHVNTPRP